MVCVRHSALINTHLTPIIALSLHNWPAKQLVNTHVQLLAHKRIFICIRAHTRTQHAAWPMIGSSWREIVITMFRYPLCLETATCKILRSALEKPLRVNWPIDGFSFCSFWSFNYSHCGSMLSYRCVAFMRELPVAIWGCEGNGFECICAFF